MNWKINVRACLLAIASTALFAVAPAQAQGKFPDKPVKVVLPFGPGGVADVTMRLVAQKLTERLGQNFIVENRPGGGSVIAAKAVMTSPADGYTLFLSGNSAAINHTLLKSKPYDILKDFTPVSMLTQFEILLVTKADSQLDTLPKILAYAKANPGKLNFGAINVGSTQNLSVHLLRLLTGAQVEVVPYRTTPDLSNAIARGDVHLGFDYLAAFKGAIQGNQMKVVATSGEAPNPQLPGAPQVKDLGYPEYVVISWNGLFAPAGTPKAVIDKLNAEIQAVLQLPDIKERTKQVGISPMLGSPADMAKRLDNDIVKWRTVIEKSGIPKL